MSGPGVAGSLAIVPIPTTSSASMWNSDHMAVAWVVDNMPLDRDLMPVRRRAERDSRRSYGHGSPTAKGYIQVLVDPTPDHGLRADRFARFPPSSPGSPRSGPRMDRPPHGKVNGDAIGCDRLLANVSIYWFTRRWCVGRSIPRRGRPL